MSTLIGLSLRVRLLRALPAGWRVDVRVRPGTHQSERSVNKQLADKERVAAALENRHLLGVVLQALESAWRRGGTREGLARAGAGAGVGAGAVPGSGEGDDAEQEDGAAGAQADPAMMMMMGDPALDRALEQAEVLARQLGVAV